MQTSERLKIFAVAGNPISHSLSPKMINKGMKAIDFNGYYTRLATDSSKEIISVMKKLGIEGCNVTAPFKENIVRNLDLLDGRVQQIGASNVIVKKGHQYAGYNTDVNGIFLSLSEFKINFQARTALIVGYGGAARAVAYTCRMMQMQTYVTGKDPHKLEDFAQNTGCIPVEFEEIQNAINSADVIISTLPKEAVLLHRVTFSEQQIVVDCSYYNPELEEKVVSRNAFYIDGKRWLLYQACPAFKIFTGADAPAGTMFNASQEERESPEIISLISSSENTLNTVSAHLVDFEKCTFINFEEDVKGSFRKLKKRARKMSDKSVAIILMTTTHLEDEDICDYITNNTFSFWLANDAEMKKEDACSLVKASKVILPIDGKAGAHVANRIRREIENLF